MDIQFWIWLAIIVLTFLARARRKKPDQRPQQGQESTPEAYRPREEATTPMTFEELLREIQESKAPARKEAPRQPEVVDYDDDIKEEVQDMETIPAYRDDRHSTELYENAKRDAFMRPSLEETVKLEDTIVRFGAFHNYEIETQKGPLDDYVKELQDPEGFKKAFILSEILKRRF